MSRPQKIAVVKPWCDRAQALRNRARLFQCSVIHWLASCQRLPNRYPPGAESQKQLHRHRPSGGSCDGQVECVTTRRRTVPIRRRCHARAVVGNVGRVSSSAARRAMACRSTGFELSARARGPGQSRGAKYAGRLAKDGQRRRELALGQPSTATVWKGTCRAPGHVSHQRLVVVGAWWRYVAAHRARSSERGNERSAGYGPSAHTSPRRMSLQPGHVPQFAGRRHRRTRPSGGVVVLGRYIVANED